MTMPDFETSDELKADALSAGLYDGCCYVSEFILSKVRPLGVRAIAVKEGAASGATQMIIGQLVRVSEWLRTFVKLDSPDDYQALSSGTRAILETAVDIVLLTEDPTRWKSMHAWEISARMNHAAAIARFMEGKLAEERDEHVGPISFYQLDHKKVDADRLARGWVKTDKKGKTKPYHPGRWTARDLSADAKAADKVVAGRFFFEAFYETRYRELCYLTHGAGSAFRPVRAADVFSFVGGRCYAECADMAILCAELVIKYLDGWTSEVEQIFDTAMKERAIRQSNKQRQVSGRGS